MAATTLAVTAGPDAALAAPSAKCPSAAADEAAAIQAAAACHGRVEVSAARDERTQVFANANGTLTAETSAVVRQIRTSAGAWVKPDATLRPAGGRYSPVATSLKLSFSAGGTGPAVTIGKGSAELALTWPTALPAPTVTGATATYPNVFPDVDLVLTAQAEGFAEMLVVKNAEAATNAALSAISFTTSSKGLRLRQGAGGELDAVDPSGAVLFGSGAPAMWDSIGEGQAARADAPSPASRLRVPATDAKVMPVELSGDQLVLHPDVAMLRDPATRFPVYIDPAIGKSAWTMINSTYPSQSYWSFDRQDCPSPHTALQCAKVGYATQPKAMVYRSLFAFNIGGLLKKHVQSAILSMDTVYSYTNDDYATEVRVTGGIGSGTTWSNNAGTWGAVAASAKSHAHDRKPRRTEWGLTAAVQKAANGSSATLTLGLRAPKESSVNYWKKFNAGSALLTVTYNSYPNPPDNITVGEMPCKSGAARPYVRTLTPSVRARLTDPDGTGRLLKGTFYWFKTTRSSTDSVAQGSIVHNQYATVKIPAGRLTDNTTYTLQGITSDGVDNGQPATCEFTVDVTPPGAPAAVTSTVYPADGQGHGGAGVTGSFTFKPPASVPTDFWGYAYTLDPAVAPASATQVAATATDKTVTVNLTPNSDRAYNLRVWARDKAGNFSTSPFTYSFTVAAGAGPAARWTFDERTGDDLSEHGNTATITDGAFGAGRGNYGYALTGNGTSTSAVTAGPLTTRDSAGQPVTVHSNQSFTVAATVRLDSAAGSGQRVIVAQDGNRTSPFSLSYSIADKKWRFAVAATDVDAPATAAVLSNTTVTPGVWTRLVATYDGTSQALRLFVDGVQQTATAASATFDAGKGVTIGRGKQAGASAGYFAGLIDDLRIYNRLVLTTEQEFGNLQRPNPPLISFPAGATVFAGRSLSVQLDAGGDTAVTAVQYQLGAAGPITKVNLPAAGGTTTVSVAVPTTSDGPYDLFAQGFDAAGRQSTTASSEVTVEQPPTLTGTISDALTNVPLAGATVHLTPGDLTQTTSATGTYTFSGIDEGDYTLTVDNGGVGCAAATATREEIAVARTVRIDLLLAPQADVYGYMCRSATSTPFVAGTTKLTLTGDDEAVKVPTLPFAVPYYGKTYNSLWVSTNGFVSFTDPADRNYYTAVSLPNRRNAPWAALAPFLSDLVIDASSSVWTATTGTGAGQRFVVEWRNALLAGTTSRVTFEAVLAPDGSVTFNYSGLTGDPAKGADTAVGITSPGGNFGLQYSFQEPTLASGTAITFVAPADPGPDLTGSISGTITTAAGEPRAGVHLWLDDHATQTDAAGFYRFEDVENGTYNLYGVTGCDELEEQRAVVDGDSWLEVAMYPAADTFGNTCAVTAAAWTPGDTQLAFPNDYEATVVLPFPVSFYGHSFAGVTIQKWGSITFAEPADPTLGGGVQIWPGTDPVIGSQTKVYTKSLGSAPHRQFVIEWRDVGLPGSSALVDLELVLDEDSSITANVHDLPDRSVTAKDVEVYFRGTDWNALGYYEDGNGFRAGKTVTFSPPPAA